MRFKILDGHGGRLFAALAVALSASQISAFAGDQDMSVIAQASSGPIRCEIRKTVGEGSIHLTGVIFSSESIAGNARFLLTKSGPSGTSNINQGNDFKLAAGTEAYVSNVTINLRHGDHAVIELHATSGGGIACHAEALLEL
jgi:curli production assembly/transport CsgH protein